MEQLQEQGSPVPLSVLELEQGVNAKGDFPGWGRAEYCVLCLVPSPTEPELSWAALSCWGCQQ